MSIFKSLGVLFASLVILISGYIGFLYFTYIDESINTGSAYGLVIGENKSDTYKRLKNKFENQEISSMNTIFSKFDLEQKLFDIGTPISLLAFREYMYLFDHWSIYLDEDTFLLAINFNGSTVENVVASTELSTNIQTLKFSNLVIQIEALKSQKEVYEFLLDTDSLVDNELLIRSGWMAFKQPSKFDESEFHLVENKDTWKVYIGECCFNSIRLKFEENILVELHRHQQFFELP